MLTFLFAVLAAGANAASSVLQRKAHREHPIQGSVVAQAVAVLRAPVWLLGIAAVVLGFLLQAAALSQGAISVVEPILVIELPLTLLLAGAVFRRPLSGRDWLASLAMTAGVSALLWALAPTPHGSETAPNGAWIVGGVLNAGLVIALYVAATRADPARRAALLGVATGSGFALTVAFVKTVTDTVTRDGFLKILGAWQTYGMVLAGLSAMLLMQGALSAGSLVAAQPGITLADPILSTLWGVLAFHETIRTGWFLIAALGAALVVAAGAVALAHSPLLASAHSDESVPSSDVPAAVSR